MTVDLKLYDEYHHKASTSQGFKTVGVSGSRYGLIAEAAISSYLKSGHFGPT